MSEPEPTPPPIDPELLRKAARLADATERFTEALLDDTAISLAPGFYNTIHQFQREHVLGSLLADDLRRAADRLDEAAGGTHGR
jgi:hypothetical protein